LLVVHTAEGSRTIESLGAWFANGDNEVSSQVGVDDKPGVIGEYVRHDLAAWCAAVFNGAGEHVELCGFAEWDPAEWARHPAMLDNLARWLAEESARYSIPLVKLDAGAAQGSGRGVCAHADLGEDGGNHWDPGPAFPWADVIALANEYAGGAPAPTKRKGRNMIASTDTGEGYWTVSESDGAVYAFGDAQYRGGANSPDVTQAGVSIVGIAGRGSDGYWLFGSDGSVFAFGSAEWKGNPDRA
jgi:hypothetical protein